MKLEYCKQCGRMISKEEVDAGEAYVSADESYCKTCALGKGLDVSVGTTARRRRRSSASNRPAAAGRRSPTSLVALLVIVCAVAAVVTVAAVAMFKPGVSGQGRGRTAPVIEPPAPPTVNGGGDAVTTPAVAHPPDSTPAPVEAPVFLSPDQIRAAARKEYDRIAARAKELEEAGRLADAIESYNDWPFEYRHTKHHDAVTGDRERLTAACRELLDGLRLRMSDLVREGKLGEAKEALRQASFAAGTQVKGRLMQAVDDALRHGIDVEVAAGALEWSGGKGVRVAVRGAEVDLAFAEGATGRSVALELPREMVWDLTHYGALELTIPDAPGEAEFVVDIVTDSSARGSGVCSLRKGGIYAVRLDGMGGDFRRVRSIRITLARPADREVKCTLKSVAIIRE